MASQNSLYPFAHRALIVLFLRPPKTPDKALFLWSAKYADIAFLGVPIMPDTSALFFRVAEKAEIAFF